MGPADARANGRVVCGFCPRRCRLFPQEVGICGAVRQVEGQFVPTFAGPPFRLHVSTTGSPFRRFLPGAVMLAVESPGSGLTPQRDARAVSWDGTPGEPSFSPEETAYLARSWGCAAVFLQTDDPYFAAGDGQKIVHSASAAGLKTALSTTAYLAESTRDQLLPVVDAIELRLYSVSPAFHRRLFAARPEPIFETVEWVKKHTHAWVEVAVPLLAGENDHPGDVERLCRWLTESLGPKTPVHLYRASPGLTDAALAVAVRTASLAGLLDVDSVECAMGREETVAAGGEG